MGVYLELFDDHTLALKCSYRDRRVKAIGERKWSPEVKRWLFPLSRSVVDNARKEFGKIPIEPQILTHLRLLDFFQAKVQKIKKLKDCHIDESFLKVKLYPHQRVGIKYCQQFEKCAIFDEMGLMKTLQAVYIAVWRKSRGEVSKCIILCPKSCQTSVWLRQIEKFTHEKGIVANGTPGKRDKLYKRFKKSGALFLILGYELFRIDREKLREMGILDSEKGIQMMILDEVQKIKNPQAQITKAVRNSSFRYCIILTGTPIFNKVQDIYSPISIVSPGLLGSNYWKFCDRYLVKGSYQGKEILGAKNLPELKSRIETVSIRRLKEEVIKLPEKVYETRLLSLTDPAQKTAYQEMREQLFTWIQNMDGEEVRIKAGQLMTRNIRLSQITDGFIMSEELSKPRWFDSSKIKEIDEIINDYGDSGIVIFCRWIPLVDFLFKRYKEAYNAVCLKGATSSQERIEAIDRFQARKAKVFVLQIQSGSLGIDLSSAKIGLFPDKVFLSPGILRQSEDRVHREGLRESCEMISLIVENSIDERWDQLVREKQALADQIIPVFSKEDWLYLAGK